MPPKYWETELATTLITSKNVLNFYPEAERLAVSRPSWVDTDGNERQGKTVTLDVASLREKPDEARMLLSELINCLG